MDWTYEGWNSGEPYDWGGAARGTNPWDQKDYHVDIGCGTVKKGRIGIDHFAAPGVNIVMDLETQAVYGLPERPNEDALIRFGPPLTSIDDYNRNKRRVAANQIRVEPLGFGLPFEESSIESVISHHCFEHIGPGFVPLIDEIYRVLKPGGILRAITPLFPSRPAVEDPDHRRYFMDGTWQTFCGWPDNHWMSSFSVPYPQARFTLEDQDVSPPTPVHQQWGEHDAREIRVALSANK